WLAQLDELKARKETLEAALAAFVPANEKSKWSNTTPTQLQAALPDDAVLVDVLQYVCFSGGHDSAAPDEVRYAALVLRKSKPVVRIELGPAQAIDDAIEHWRRDCLYKTGPEEVAVRQQLKRLIWQPLTAHLQGCRTVLYSPDAQLAELPLTLLP